MINTRMRIYNYSTFGAKDAYGQATNDGEIKGTIKMAISISSQSAQDNINYQDCNYVGLTTDELDDSYVIHFGKEKLKVLYVNPDGRYKQAFLKRL